MNDAFPHSEQWFAATLKSLGEAVITTNNAGAIVFMNAMAETLTGWTQTEALGKNILFLPLDDEVPWDEPSQAEIVIQLAADPLLLARNGRAIPIEYTGAPIKDDRGNVAGVVLVMQDVTERKQAEHALRQAKNAAEEAQQASEAANRAKSLFLAGMGHELRTPLNAILGYTQMLQEARNLTDHQRQSMAIIQRSGEHLLTLLDDILDVSAFESGHLELHAHEFELAGLLRTICDIADMQAAQKGLTFTCDQSPELPVRLYADEQRLRQVLLNLLNNAVKFTERGSVTLRILGFGPVQRQVERFEILDVKDVPQSLHGSSFNQKSQILNLKFEVQDTGVGIAADRLDDIFLPFQQIGGNYHAVDGAGLGLTICQRLLACMESELHVHSSPGQGSRFWFDIRVPAVFARAESDQTPAEPEPPEREKPAPERSLSIEIIRKLLVVAKRGNPKKLLAELETCGQGEFPHHLMVRQLCDYAANYQIERCIDILNAEEEQHLKEQEKGE